MLKNMKAKALALLAVLVLAVGALFAATPAMAATSQGKLTVTGGADFANKSVTAVRMFKVTEDGTGYELEGKWEDFFSETNLSSLGWVEGTSTPYNFVMGLKNGEDETKLVKFAELAQKWAATNKSTLSADPSIVFTSAAATGSGSNYTTSIAGLDYGYYLVSPSAGSSSGRTDEADAILVNIDAPEVTQKLKSTWPTVDKTVKPEGGQGEGENADGAAVGDTLEFALTSAVPDMSAFDPDKGYTFKFTDKLSSGLTLKPSAGFNSANVTVTIGNAPLTSTDFTASATAGTAGDAGKTVLTIDLSEYFSKILKGEVSGINAGDKVIVTYKATLNSNAVIATDPNTNEVTVDYSTDPDNPQKGTPSVPDKTYTYTFGFGVDKRAEEATGNRLAGAKFQLYKDSGNGTYAAGEETLLKFDAGAGSNPVKYMYNASGTVDTITTTATDNFMVCGLDEGTYWLVETDAPEGYNEIGAIKVVISAEYNQATGELTRHTIKYTMPGEGQQEQEVNHPNHTITVINKAGTLLPETGGMGTVIFTVIGVAVIAGGAAWYVSRRRSSGAHNA